MNLSIQPAPADQLPAMYGVMALAGEHMHRVLGLSHWHPFPASDWFIKHSEGKDVFGVYDDTVLMGTFNISTQPESYYRDDMSAFWRYPDQPALYFSAFALLPSYQQQGAGSWCMAQVDRMAQERGHTQLRFDAVSNHAKLLAFYERNGYEPRGVLDLGKVGVMCFEKQYDESS